MRQYVITGINGAYYFGYPQPYGPWFQPAHHGYPYHSIWEQSHPHSHYHHYPYLQGKRDFNC
ncbi:hypothetical protein [Cytobacillus sp. NCCP-133]|uniref:hypothetical protein n=1 Tax=Cytobacillus sp. NCCP-133 TaxID=766848 RepID=UPI0022313E31|nr:hypothetical protein [Cytobacillus sp. NCCP-133]